MKILSGVSTAQDAAKALDEATGSWAINGNDIQFLIVFHSTSQDPRKLAAEIKKRFPGVPSVGCTTAGEYLDGKRLTGSLVVSAVVSKEIRWAVAPVNELSKIDSERAAKVALELSHRLGLTLENLDSKRHFCLGFFDGLSKKEERSAALLADAFEGIPFLGGSAGDDLKFVNTFVMANGECLSDAAVVVLGESSIPFHVIKHQHFLRSERDLVVTEVNVAERKVLTFDGRPAAEAYARALGLSIERLSPAVFSMHPLTFSCNNEVYVRSIQKAEADGSLVFYCAVEEGMVLEIANHLSMEETLRNDVEKVRKTLKRADWFIGCNCILRSLEASSKNYHDTLGKILSNNLARQSIGFDTYGEQLNGLHINQTLVGIVFGEAA
ncbi:MAG: FIST N-terminal domain-containing protein [Bdellovibrionota bacterium]